MKAADDKTRTRNGFVRSQHLSEEQLAGIMEGIAAGGREGEVCREHDTSFTQFLRRVRSDSALMKRYRQADLEKHRARALASRHEQGGTSGAEAGDRPGVHESEVPD